MDVANTNDNIIGVTMGCPAGIGPEIVLRYFSDADQTKDYRVVVLGDAGVLKRCAKELSLPVTIATWQAGQEIKTSAINVADLSALAADLVWGKPNVQTGKAMAVYIEEAVRLLKEKELSAMVTCPIGKATLQAAGYDYPGHTEMLAQLCNTSNFGMMMAGAKLRVTLVTIHKRLADVSRIINQELILKTIALTHDTLCQDFGVAKPRIAVAGLNPHAGEAGIFGDEELQKIIPAVEEARSSGWDVRGPYPPDTIFNKAVKGDFDAVVCMYHDQGLIPFKLLHFEDGVNVTMGLPIVRTSVDHGTAYDIAGKGIADPSSLKAAIAMAAQIVGNRRNF